MMIEKWEECPKCGYPGPAPDDDALWFRYRKMSEQSKAEFRAAANAIMDAAKIKEGEV